MQESDQELIRRLNSVSLSDIKKFSFDGYTTYAKVLKVHDADTITLIFEYKDEIIKYNIRIDGIDAPELHSKISEEAALSKKGKDFLSNLLLYTIVKVRFKDFDKYGRALADIYTLTSPTSRRMLDTNVSQILIQGGYVRPYDGGTKEDWSEFLNKHHPL